MTPEDRRFTGLETSLEKLNPQSDDHHRDPYRAAGGHRRPAAQSEPAEIK
jgi:hypothetical protein